VTTSIIYLLGRPGFGKKTIALELCKYDFRLCDNQLINTPIFTLILDENNSIQTSDIVWEGIRDVRSAVLKFLSRHTESSYVLTNNLYNTDWDRAIYSSVKRMAESRGSKFIPVQLEISDGEHVKRLTDPSRVAHLKSVDIKHVHDEQKLIEIEHPNLIRLDVSDLSPAQAATEILDRAGLRNSF